MRKLYNILIAVLAIASIVLAILDLCEVISLDFSPFRDIDNVIILIFTIDYVVRFFSSKERKRFFKENIFDLVAIIPYNSIFSVFRAFRLFRLIKLSKLMRFTRVIRAAAFFGVVKRKISIFLKTNGFIYVLYANAVMILFSSIIIMFAENMTFADSIWWSFVTCTTVGYGDIYPTTTIGRVTAVILMLFGIGLIGMLTSTITTYFTNRNEIEVPTVSDSDIELEKLISQMNEEQKKKLTEIAKIIMQ